MKEITITTKSAGQRIDKFLLKLLPGMGKSLCYKMFRKKNITLNNKKIQGNELIVSGDLIKVFFSDETYKQLSEGSNSGQTYKKELPRLDVVYEDDQLLVVNKPVGVFSQPDPEGVSIIEMILNNYNEGDLPVGFVPGIVNRLDRNTSGLIFSAKDMPTVQRLNELIKSGQTEKNYRTIVFGQVLKPMKISGYLLKDEVKNQVKMFEKPIKGGDYIETHLFPLRSTGEYTELDVRIITGKTHQIRLSLAHIGHPILGDTKYGNKDKNLALQKKYHLYHHLLHAHSYRFLDQDGGALSTYHKAFIAPLPQKYITIATDIFNSKVG